MADVHFRRIPIPTKEEIAEFWGRVDKRGPDECWPLIFKKKVRGKRLAYGSFVIQMPPLQANVFSLAARKCILFS